MSSDSRSLRSSRSYKRAAFSDSQNSPRTSDESDTSAGTRTTAETSVFESPRPSLKDTFRSERRGPATSYSKTPRTVVVRHLEAPQFNNVSYTNAPLKQRPHLSMPRSSEETCTSTRTQEYYDEPEEYDAEQDFVFELPGELERYDTRISEAEIESRATTPQDFADYFPSQRRLFIHHDESAHDGNMNLKVDTEEVDGDRKTNVQLFHLRMRDLESRDFSLRRYCRESGREVCHSYRRYQLPTSERPGIQRSVSNALANLRPDFKRMQSKDSAASAPVRADSGYGSHDDEDYFGHSDEVDAFMAEKRPHGPKEVATRSIKLEFSNYAQVDVKRTGVKKSKQYAFEYWGSTYSWKRVVDDKDATKTIKFHLVRHGSNKAVAHIIPVFQTPGQVCDEQAKGGWVPPCNLWISDPAILTAYTDVADVIISTGLIALVDDCIKRHFNPKHKRASMQLQVPLTPLKMEVDFAGPKAMVSHMFRRRSSGASAHRSEGRSEEGNEYMVVRGSPLRNSSMVEAN